MRYYLRIVVATALSLWVSATGAEESRVVQKLKAAQPVKIVCLGDSVTGVYYHTGGRRAYPEMLEIAIESAWPKGKVSVINAGISGNTTADGLKRFDNDVLSHQPDLVTVMFGLNDMVRVPIAEFEANLAEFIRRCRAGGAEVLLCTPNSVIDTSPRPIARLVEYCGAVKRVAEQRQVPVCDVYGAYESLRGRDPLQWRMMLSDEIHPNMDGHKLTAETLCRSIAERDVSLDPVGPPQPAMPRLLTLVNSGKPIRVLAMDPYDRWIAPALKSVVPDCKVEVTCWSTAGRTLAEIEQEAKGIRNAAPDVVLVAVPLAVTPEVDSPPEEAIRAYRWILNWSLSFGQQQWDVAGIAPSVLKAPAGPEERARDAFARRMILAQDLSLVGRAEGDASPPERILESWLRTQLGDR